MELNISSCRLWNNFTTKSSGWGKEMKDLSKSLEDATLVDGQKVSFLSFSFSFSFYYYL